MISHLLFFLLFFLPFIVLPFGTTPFETPKIVIAEILIGLLLFYALYKADVANFKWTTKYLPYSIIFVLTIVHLIFRMSETVFFGNSFRLQGVFLLWVLLGFSVISSRITMRYLSLYVVGGLLIAHVILGFIIAGSGEEMRAIGTLGEPNAFAANVLFLWPFLFFNTSNGKKATAVKIIGFLCVVFILLMSGSRSGMIAFALQSLFLFAHLVVRLGTIKTLAIVGFFFIASLVLPFLDEHTLYERRDDIWTAALIAGYEHPVIGWGFGNTEKALEKYNDKLYNSAHGYYVDSSHNIFLDWWVQGGIIGLSVLVLLVIIAGRTFVKKEQITFLVILIGFIAVMSFNPVSVVTLVQFWWAIGLSFVMSTKSKQKKINPSS